MGIHSRARPTIASLLVILELLPTRVKPLAIFATFENLVMYCLFTYGHGYTEYIGLALMSNSVMKRKLIE